MSKPAAFAECRGPHTVIGGKSDDIDGRDATSSQPGAEQDRFVCWRAAVKPGVARRRAPLEEEFIDGDVEAVVELRTGSRRRSGPARCRQSWGVVTGRPVLTRILMQSLVATTKA